MKLGDTAGPGQTVGPYTIVDTVGSGGMASVFRATHTSGEVRALKVLHPASIHADDAEDLKRFKREFETVAQLSHPNVVKVHEAGVEDRYPWIAMELVDGPDLDALLERWQRERPADRMSQVQAIFRGLCEAFVYLHGRGLVHRDLKPGNIIVSSEGVPKVTDFGVVKNPEATWTQLTVAGKLVGTVAFMAPEQITNDSVDQRADLYALGAVLYMMLTFKRPIEAKSVAGYLARHLTEVPTAPSQLVADVPPKLERICQRLLLKDPDQRYSSARAVLEALDSSDDDSRLPLRGRDQQTETWLARLSELSKGGGGVLAIHGPSGSGRSHVLDQFTRVAAGQGITVLRPDLDGLDDLAERASEGPTVVAFDDLDRSPGTIDALGRAIRDLVTVNGRPVLLAFTAADLEVTAIHSLVNGMVTGVPATTITLGPLDRRAVITIHRDRHITGAAAPVLGRRLHEDYGGMPGPILQQIDALQASGWLAPSGDTYKAARPIEDFRKQPLPVPDAVREVIEGQLAGLDEAQMHLVRTMAVLARPGTPALLQRAAGDDDVGRRIDTLVRSGLLRRNTDGEQEVVALAHPATASVVYRSIDRDERRRVHAAIARALGVRRRRAPALEIAQHLLKAGDPLQAYRQFVAAARASARNQRHREVLDICGRAISIRETVKGQLDPEEAVKLERWLFTLEGEARLAAGDWQAAVKPLERAVHAARKEGDTQALARVLGNLGRAHYRQAHFDRARPLLEEALQHADPGAPERASATRALADIELRVGNLDASERLWDEALDIAQGIGSRDAQARARRGMAHLRGVQGDLSRTAELLDIAEELLMPDGDPRVLAGVLARSIELDWAAGRWATGLRRATMLLEHVQNNEMPERLPEAHALLAEMCSVVGDVEAVYRHIRHALTYASTLGDRVWDARLRVARLLAVHNRYDDVEAALPTAEAMPDNRIDDPAAQAAAIRSRAMVHTKPLAARDLATWAMVRPVPMLAVRGAKIAIDVCWTLAEAGDVDRSRTAAKRGLKVLKGPGMDGLRLGVLLALQKAQNDQRVLEAAGTVAKRIGSQLPPELQHGFVRTPGVADALRSVKN